MSIVSVETGKTIVKSSKAAVRNGSCQWTETVSESIWVSKDGQPSKELEDFPYKLVVAMVLSLKEMQISCLLLGQLMGGKILISVLFTGIS